MREAHWNERSGTGGGIAGIAAMVGGVLVVLGSALPWVTIHLGAVRHSIAGTDGDGKSTLVLGLVAVLCAAAALWPRVHLAAARSFAALAGIAGVASLLVIVYDWHKLATLDPAIRQAMSAGTGFYLVSAGAIALTVAASALFVRRADRRVEGISAGPSGGDQPRPVGDLHRAGALAEE